MKSIGYFFLFIIFLFFSGGLAHADNNEDMMQYQGMDRNNDGKITLEEWQGSFDNHDWNGDGVLSDDEVKPGARRPKGNSAYFNQFRTVDRNNNGVISSSEWSSGFNHLDQDRSGNLSDKEFGQSSGNQFRTVDRNNNGVISSSEWSSGFNRLDQDRNGNLSDEEFNQRSELDQFSELDYNNDEVISRDEWSNTSRSFEALDLNRDGKLNRDEFYNQQRYTVSVFQELDQNNDGKISRSEWRSTSDAFNLLDTNEDDLLSENEFNDRQDDSLIERIFQEIFKK